ncbi:MAG: UDP-N-acetylglucosamine 2-epimerase (hydrolyzing) [Desulfobacteraceae bacterium]|nr:UDP-N-acetylglucosamine 2-epimerase (hydrolyzing) [Desulfobacteraceae bacterium]
MKRQITIFTSTRAEYGLLRRVVLEIQQSQDLDLRLLVSGTHLVSDQGYTIEEIQSDGIEDIECIDIKLNDNSAKGICASMGVAIQKYGKFLNSLQPDILLLLGDRYETFCCAAAAQVCGVPVAHVHGGERTEGLIDEAFRHSITKMSHIHFPCSEEYKNRIIQMGEPADKVYNVGSLGVENIRKMKLMNRHELENSIQFKLDNPFFLITFHPVTLEKNTSGEQFAQLLAALDNYSAHKCIFTGANADTDGNIIDQMIKDYTQLHPDRCFSISSLGYLRYLSAMQFCEAVIGNSSSGILEAPALKVPTINIGDRQKGRTRAESIVDCEPLADSILESLKKVFSDQFQRNIKEMKIPHEQNDTAHKIQEVIRTIDLENILKKSFFDIN